MLRPTLFVASLSLLAACAPDWQPTDPGDGAAFEAFEADGNRMENFVVGGTSSSPLADYLFVIDGSKSMEHVLNRFEEGVRTLSEAGVFPERARIAVMNTTPGDPLDLTRPHQVVGGKKQAAAAPGFLGLVDADKLKAYKRQFPKVRASMAEPGCDAWFGAGETNANGVPCLIAHAQIDLQAVQAEAGLTAFKQLLQTTDGPLFRPGANVNVIFISDTHDPGVPSQRANGLPNRWDRVVGGKLLQADQPDFADLEDMVKAAQPIASFRAHAIAPETECAEVWSEFGPTYFAAAEAGGGQKLDVCTALDYSGFLRDTIAGGAVATAPVLALGRPADSVSSVTVAEEPAPFTVDRGAVVLDAMPTTPTPVSITYLPQQP